MISKQKPKIGFLGLMHGLYDKSQPEIPANQEKFAKEVVNQLKDVAGIDFPEVAKDRQQIEKVVKYFNDKEYDGIMVVNLIYSPGMRVVQAIKMNKLPLLLACIQPLPSVTRNWNWSLLTTNQGIHGIQDTSNMIMRIGEKPEIIVDDWKSDTFKSYFSDWAESVHTIAQLRKMKIAKFGRMRGMGDIKGDDAAFYRKFGLEVNDESIGDVYRYMDSITSNEIDIQIEEDKKNFTIDPNLPEESHRYAARLQIAFEKFMKDRNYSGFSPQFDVFKEDGRFKQIPILGGSNLLAMGYGYSAEGDTNTVALTMIGHLLIENPHFTEMYSLDFEKDAAMMSHMGEGNWKIARKDRPVKLIDRPLDIGDLENPPTLIFSGEPGTAVITTLVAIEGDKYRLVVSKGENLDTEEIPGIPMNYTFFKPDTGIKRSMEEWLRNGGTHHQVMFLGDPRRKLKILCDILDIEYIEV
ncbi:MAG: L-arabinose isomerase family protein [Candidatus Humimicrobiaceae bacterium]